MQNSDILSYDQIKNNLATEAPLDQEQINSILSVKKPSCPDELIVAVSPLLYPAVLLMTGSLEVTILGGAVGYAVSNATLFAAYCDLQEDSWGLKDKDEKLFQLYKKAASQGYYENAKKFQTDVNDHVKNGGVIDYQTLTRVMMFDDPKDISMTLSVTKSQALLAYKASSAYAPPDVLTLSQLAEDTGLNIEKPTATHFESIKSVVKPKAEKFIQWRCRFIQLCSGDVCPHDPDAAIEDHYQANEPFGTSLVSRYESKIENKALGLELMKLFAAAVAGPIVNWKILHEKPPEVHSPSAARIPDLPGFCSEGDLKKSITYCEQKSGHRLDLPALAR